MLKKSAFVILAALTATVPVVGGTTAQAQSSANLQCWHDGDPKHFRPECRDPLRERVEVKKAVNFPSSEPRNRAEFNAENLFDQMMRDSGGGAGGGGGGR